VPWFLLYAACLAAGAAIVVICWRTMRRARRSLGDTVSACSGELRDQARPLADLGTPADWSRA
jgi:hypothetical protein